MTKKQVEEAQILKLERGNQRSYRVLVLIEKDHEVNHGDPCSSDILVTFSKCFGRAIS